MMTLLVGGLGKESLQVALLWTWVVCVCVGCTLNAGFK